MDVAATEGGGEPPVLTITSATISLAGITRPTRKCLLQCYLQLYMDLTDLTEDLIDGVDMAIEGRLAPGAPWAPLLRIASRPPGSVTNWTLPTAPRAIAPEIRLRVDVNNSSNAAYHAFTVRGRVILAT